MTSPKCLLACTPLMVWLRLAARLTVIHEEAGPADVACPVPLAICLHQEGADVVHLGPAQGQICIVGDGLPEARQGGFVPLLILVAPTDQ